ncbi:GMP/IMP nucleotidase [Porticoccaceae bacterium]|jgi:HAD superfamily hydrolase (TIGR01509 family)|nr:GMP/IMP nucleotidase [Porticoccaceae bacterium]MDC3199464.1 GMP/IMP nucleotidase [Porticoccaceae bacterium]
MVIDWTKIDTVLLDMDGTLLDLHFDNFFWLQHLPECYVANFPGEEKKALDDLKRQLFEKRGTLDWYCTDFWSHQLDLDVVGLKKKIHHLISERPKSLLFLKALSANNKQRILVTNAHPDSVALKFSVTDIKTELDIVVSSHEYGFPKESLDFWRAFQQKCPFDPQRTLFIDDSESVLDAAQRYGVANLLCVDSPDSTIAAKKKSKYSSISHFEELLSHNGKLHYA